MDIWSIIKLCRQDKESASEPFAGMLPDKEVIDLNYA
jgi:hypothetical protein